MPNARRRSRKSNHDYLKRPAIVTAIALTEFAKAGLILLATLLAWRYPGAQYRSGILSQIYYVFSSGRTDFDGMALLFAGYALAVGCGLWFVEKWARRTLMATSGLSSLFWFTNFVLEWRNGGSLADLMPHYDLPNLPQNTLGLYALIMIDAAIFLYLAFGRDVPEAFRQLDPR